ncbi:MAG: hypothetical protein Ct9H90mP20_6950 [Candidatus Neomarinimicrobiota bacterium]|nr:MAG: hypothetical protein Ct9H90mP20_6950 [Candidatus Neomarinimicrobiota bacterium]
MRHRTIYALWDDLSVSDIVWEGERTSVKKKAEQSGVDSFKSSSDLQKKNRPRKDVHILPVYRDDQKFFLQSLLNVSEISPRNL